MLATLFLFMSLPAAGEPVSLHPANPHYLIFRGKPTVLISSTEHYGAVLNGDFDAISYLDELHNQGLNFTRTFSGTYREVEGSLRSPQILLPPNPKSLSLRGLDLKPKELPMAVTSSTLGDSTTTTSAAQDLRRSRGKRGIIVEFVLFCPFYEENLWEVNPMNARNNVGGRANTQNRGIHAQAPRPAKKARGICT